jgi:DNA mismatch repair protein MutS
MSFQSILFPKAADSQHHDALKTNVPDFFADLNLDQIVNTITAGKEEYNLKPFCYTGPVDLETIDYRQRVMQDLENEVLLGYIRSFAGNMRKVRQGLIEVEKLYYKYQKERLFLDIVGLYCQTVNTLTADLSRVDMISHGLIAFWNYLKSYVQSSRFQSLVSEIKKITNELASVRYCIHIGGLRVQVREYRSETNYSTEVEETFAKFKQGAVKNYLSDLPHSSSMNDVEARILDGVVQLHPDYFSHLNHFYEEHLYFQDEVITTFDREIQFYVAYVDYMSLFKKAGLTFCYPRVSATDMSVFNNEGFDLALAGNLIRENSSVVVNDFFLKGEERILVVSGPNQGGKTTFARTFGQLHYLAGIGCPVPGREARLFLYDRLFTHFEREEDIRNLRGKLQDELVRIHEILEQATPDSIIIINEIFTSTTLQDQIFLSKKIMERLAGLDLLCTWVTFIDELASVGEQTVSMVSSVVPENPALRTYKITRRPADGLAYALSVAEKYRLTYSCLKNRLNHERVPVT